MAKPKPSGFSLSDLISESEGTDQAPAAAPASQPPKGHPSQPSGEQPDPEQSRPVSVQFFLADKDRLRLKQIGLDARMSLNAICHEALSAWLEARGLPPLEWTAANFPSGRRPKG